MAMSATGKDRYRSVATSTTTQDQKGKPNDEIDWNVGCACLRRVAIPLRRQNFAWRISLVVLGS
jgi:hypothetical protein